MKFPEHREEPGWIGVFTREDAPGARFQAGARIEKVSAEPGDAHAIGAKGTVLGSIRAPGQLFPGYFIEWDMHPKMAVLVIGPKIGDFGEL